MLANEIVERYIEALLEVPDIWNKFSIPPVWVPEVIRALTHGRNEDIAMRFAARSICHSMSALRIPARGDHRSSSRDMWANRVGLPSNTPHGSCSPREPSAACWWRTTR
jgi:hypothetical protein